MFSLPRSERSPSSGDAGCTVDLVLAGPIILPYGLRWPSHSTPRPNGATTVYGRSSTLVGTTSPYASVNSQAGGGSTTAR